MQPLFNKANSSAIFLLSFLHAQKKKEKKHDALGLTFAIYNILMPDRSWFIDWFNSPYYELLYQNRNEAEALLFISHLIQHLKPAPNNKMLDAGCGNGRHSKALADMGFEVYGIDISSRAIEFARQFETSNLHFFEHDLRLPFWINYFDYAFSLFTSFGYFRTQREHDNTIRTIAQSLKSDAVFVMDYLNVRYEEAQLQKKDRKQVDGVCFHISKWHDEEHFFKQIQVEENGVPVKHLYTEKVAKFSLGDFTDMFAYQGLQIQEVYGDYQFGRFDIRKSPRMIIIARKNKNAA